MQFERVYDAILAHASYFLGDETSGTAVVIDPKRDIETYLEMASSRGMKIKYVVLTRMASGFVTGHREFWAHSAEIICSSSTLAEFPVRRIADGDEIKLGPQIKLKFLLTPGATPDGLSCLVYENGTPWGIFTGDTLPVDAVPRVDGTCVDVTMGYENLENQAAKLFETIHQKLLALPHSVKIYPVRGFTTNARNSAPPPPIVILGQQIATNSVLKLDRKSFITSSIKATHSSPPPIYGTHTLQHNYRDLPILSNNLEDVKALDINQVIKAIEKGAILSDGRPSLDFCLAHLKGSFAFPQDACYAPWIGTLVALNKPLILLCHEGRVREAAINLSRIGLDLVWGYLKDSISEIRLKKPELVTQTPMLSALEVQRSQNNLIDVRNSSEYAYRHLFNSTSIQLFNFPTQASLKLKKDQPQILVSERGDRAVTAASILEQQGFKYPTVLMGGLRSWEESGCKIEIGVN